MAEVVVVGAGLGGLAVAARLAKQQHHVTVVERNAHAGGAIGRIEQDGFSWESGATSTALPAVLRDLFRKSGRPLERYVELTHRPVARRHVFADKSFVDLPTGSRGSQIDAVDAGLGAGTGQQWAQFVDSQAEVWETLRREVLDVPTGGRRFADRDLAKALNSSTSLEKLLKRRFSDERLRLMVAHTFTCAGSHPRDVPAFAAVQMYVERSFGVWGCEGGMSSIIDALVTRMAERGIDARYDSEVAGIDIVDGSASGVRLANGERLAADVVITDIDPRQVFNRLLPTGTAPDAARSYLSATPAIPPSVTHLGIEGDVPQLPDEVVFHGDPALVLLTGGAGQVPEGRHAWTVYRRGNVEEDVLLSLVRRGVDLRDQIVSRVDRSAVDIVGATGGSAYGTAWDGWRANARRAGQVNPVPGLFLVGASVHPGSSIPYVGWGAAHVAQLVTDQVASPRRS